MGLRAIPHWFCQCWGMCRKLWNSTNLPPEEARCATWMGCSSMWSQDTVHQRIIQWSSPRQTGNAVHPISKWHHPILRLCSRSQHATSLQWNWCQSISFNSINQRRSRIPHGLCSCSFYTTICYHASNMILHIDSDASYLVMLKAHSCIAGYYYLTKFPPPKPAIPNPVINGAIHVKCKTIQNVMASAA